MSDELVKIPDGWKVNETPIARAMFAGEGYDWGGLMLYLDRVHDMGIDGEGVKIGVIDSGMYFGHKDLDDEVYFANFTDDKDELDQSGHGTHVRGIINMQKNGKGFIGVAPRAKVHIAKALAGKNGIGYANWLVSALEWFVDEVQVDWINMSLSLGKEVPAITKWLDKAEAKGIGIVAASGNETADRVSYPASHHTVVATGAIDMQERLAWFSNIGKHLNQLSVVAPGVNIRSTWIDGDLRSSDGTSMAAPFVTGVCALTTQRLRQLHLPATPENVRMLIEGFAKDLGDPGNDLKYGHGRLSTEWFGMDTVEDDIQSCKDGGCLDPNHKHLKNNSGCNPLFAMLNTVLSL